MVNVVLLSTVNKKQKWSICNVDLDKSTLDDEFGVKLTFSYYRELEDGVLAAMTPIVPQEETFHVFTYLINNEPIDITTKFVKEIFQSEPVFISSPE